MAAQVRHRAPGSLCPEGTWTPTRDIKGNSTAGSLELRPTGFQDSIIQPRHDQTGRAHTVPKGYVVFTEKVSDSDGLAAYSAAAVPSVIAAGGKRSSQDHHTS